MIIRLFILAFLFQLAGIARGQSRYHFYTLGIEQGLSNPSIWTIGQDKYGFIWMGTANGLNRYDGHTIKQYFHHAGDSTSLPGNTVYWIHTDKDGDMWMACGGKGIARYNYAKDCFERLPQFDRIKKSQ
jgi:ligand-binding sensor domain-containing protein